MRAFSNITQNNKPEDILIDSLIHDKKSPSITHHSEDLPPKAPNNCALSSDSNTKELLTHYSKSEEKCQETSNDSHFSEVIKDQEAPDNDIFTSDVSKDQKAEEDIQQILENTQENHKQQDSRSDSFTDEHQHDGLEDSDKGVISSEHQYSDSSH